jgi:hypothetical protein
MKESGRIMQSSKIKAVSDKTNPRHKKYPIFCTVLARFARMEQKIR